MRRNVLPMAVVTATLLFTGACGASNDPAKDSSASSPAASSSAAKLIDYGDDGVQLQAAEDVDKLKGAPEDFKQFVAGAVSEVAKDGGATGKCDSPYVSVSKVDPAGYALGYVFDCDNGGAVHMWAKVDGIWRRIFDGQSIPPCDDMKKYSVPKGIAGTKCDDGSKAVDYRG
ncbi:MAG TPA: hypothetical protein VE174_15085 [Actinomycetota bacterium]|nr:hypothetical protein [Actinomycetota bacterium]